MTEDQEEPGPSDRPLHSKAVHREPPVAASEFSPKTNLGPVELVYLLLPMILWPLSFIVFRAYFIYSLAASVSLLAIGSFILWRPDIRWSRGRFPLGTLGIGLLGAALLYLLFVGGNIATTAVGLGGDVQNVYGEIYGNQSGIVLVALLALIGVGEETYWRGGLQAVVEKWSPAFRKVPWVVSTAYYTGVHLSTLNPVLVGAAFVVGLVTGLVADRAGVGASILTHVIWIEAIVVFFPV